MLEFFFWFVWIFVMCCCWNWCDCCVGWGLNWGLRLLEGVSFGSWCGCCRSWWVCCCWEFGVVDWLCLDGFFWFCWRVWLSMVGGGFVWWVDYFFCDWCSLVVNWWVLIWYVFLCIYLCWSVLVCFVCWRGILWDDELFLFCWCYLVLGRWMSWWGGRGWWYWDVIVEWCGREFWLLGFGLWCVCVGYFLCVLVCWFCCFVGLLLVYLFRR